MDYWDECIREAFEDAGIVASEEQIETVVSWVEGAHDNYSQALGYDMIPSPLKMENDTLKRELEKEKRKIVCPDCKGSGIYVSYGPIHSASSDCSRCRGEGKCQP